MTTWKVAVECPQCSAYIALSDAPDDPTSKIKFPDIATEHRCTRCKHTWTCSAQAVMVIAEDRCALED